MTNVCTLYAFPPAPNPQKAVLALEEFGVPYSVKTVNVISCENLSPDFLRMSASGTVPALVVTGKQHQVITESSEIVMYAASLEQREQTSDPLLVTRWVSDLDSWTGPFYTLANDAMLKKMILVVNDYKIQLAEARQRHFPALKDAYGRSVARYRKAGEALIALQRIHQTAQWLLAMPQTHIAFERSRRTQVRLKQPIPAPHCPGISDCDVFISASGIAIEDAQTMADNQKQLVTLLDAAETQLSKTIFLAGDTYSAADVMLTCAVFLVEQASQAKTELACRPNLSAWWKGVKQRRSFKVVFGPATSPVTMLTLVLPAVIKVMIWKLLHWY